MNPENHPATNPNERALVPPQYAGMTAAAVDIAWVVPSYVNPAITAKEMSRKQLALAYLRSQEDLNNDSDQEDESGINYQVGQPTTTAAEVETIRAEAITGFEPFENQNNVQAAIKDAEECLMAENFDESTFQNLLFKFLRRRQWLHEALAEKGSGDLSWLQTENKDQSDWFQAARVALENHFKSSGIGTTENPAWFSITASPGQPETKSKSRYKVYETLDHNDYHFITKLPSLVKRLQAIGAETGECIKLKTPRSLLAFISENDSLVAHCDSEETCQKIQAAISDWKAEHSIADVPRELGRAKIAMDGKLDPESEETSFSDLVAIQITKWAIEHKDNYSATILAKEAIKHTVLLAQQTPTSTNTNQS